MPTLNISSDKLSALRKATKTSKTTKTFRYALVTFGCQMNYADSEKIQMILTQAGLQKVESYEDADIVICNTCSVRKKAEDRAFSVVNDVKKFAKREGRDIKVGFTGCMTRKTGLNKKYYEYEGRKNTKLITRVVGDEKGNDGDSFFNSDDRLFLTSDKIDFIFRIEETGALTSLLSLVIGEEVGQDDKFNDYLQIKQERENTGSANVIIQTGCDNYCTFCIVPYTRGGEVSRSIDEIVKEVSEAVKGGAKEVTLLGQNVNSYGKNTKAKLWDPEEFKWESAEVRTPFRELLEELDTIKGLDRIRFTSSNPHDMTRDILDAHFDLSSTCSYLHFALQSGNNEILGKMNRKHTYEDFKTMVEYLRSKDPLFSISTDIIVGFPGETEQQFEDTVRAFRECQFDFAYIARYSPRDQTYAAKMPGAIDFREKARRWDILNTELKKSLQSRNEMMLDRTEEVLINRIEEKYIGGRTRNFKEVFIDPDDSIKLGEIVPVKIEKIDEWVLRGVRV